MIVYHASEVSAATLRASGLVAGSDGVLWVADSPEIAELQNSAGTRSRAIKSLAKIEIDSKYLECERSHGDVNVYFVLDGDPYEVLSIGDWPATEPSTRRESDRDAAN